MSANSLNMPAWSSATTLIISLVVVLLGGEVIYLENGCPYVFDFGTLGYEYFKPNICRTMMSPLWDGKTPAINHGQPNMSTPVNFYVNKEDGSTDTYMVMVYVQEMYETFRFMDFIMKAYELKSDESVGDGAGHFERQFDFLPYCCEPTKRRNMVRFANIKGQRPFKLRIKWSPLRFKGKVKFMGNFFDSPSKWYENAASTDYDIPFPESDMGGNPDRYYDEDWTGLWRIPEF